jgi:hypothetical protein
VPRLCEFYPGICRTAEEKVRKNLSQGKKNLSQEKNLCKNLNNYLNDVAVGGIQLRLCFEG